MAGIEIAAKSQPLCEGTIEAIGFIPPHFKSMNLRVGDTVTFSRFNTVKIPDMPDYLAVKLQEIVCKKDEVALTWWDKFKVWIDFGALSFSFAIGFASHSALDLWRKISKKQ